MKFGGRLCAALGPLAAETASPSSPAGAAFLTASSQKRAATPGRGRTDADLATAGRTLTQCRMLSRTGRTLAFRVSIIAGLTATGASELLSGQVRVRRFEQNPIVRPGMLPGSDGANINGPSLIRTPAWLPNALGRYYLYFAHHGGKYIRLAYADRLEGPWRIHEPGTLELTGAPGARGHVASPDVFVDEERREIRMYFHGPAKAASGQKTFVARSRDGLRFTASDEILGSFYMRLFRWQGWWYGMAKGGLLFRSRDGLTNFEKGHNPFPGGNARDEEANDAGPRHVALHVAGSALHVYYTSIGDAPERILRTDIDLTPGWTEWRTAGEVEVLRPETEYEGAHLPVTKSTAGAARAAEHALRDPGIFVDEDGRVYLLYSVAGEQGIAVAELTTDGGGSAAAPQPARPTILIIYADPGWRDVGYRGSGFHETPNIDRLAREEHELLTGARRRR